MPNFHLLLQLAAAAHQALSPVDSLALRTRVEDARFAFIMDWRFQIEWDGFEVRLAAARGKESDRHVAVVVNPPPRAPGVPLPPIVGEPNVPFCDMNLQEVKQFTFQFSQFARYDLDQRQGLAHVVRKLGQVDFRTCGVFVRATQPENRMGIAWERRLSVEAKDTIRVLRARLLGLLDSATHALPGDRWIWGQRIRFLVDQGDIPGASRAARECRAEPWWCSALQGYVLDVIGDWGGAARAFKASHAVMPPAIRAEWDDAEYQFLYTGRVAYAALTPQMRDSINRVAWWLADPLFMDDDNDRHTEQMLRRVQVALLDGHVDLWTDWRSDYLGPPLVESVLRYGMPLDPSFKTCSSGMNLPPPGIATYTPGTPVAGIDLNVGPKSSWPIPYRPGDTRHTHLGCTNTLVAAYAIPEFHTMPRWRGVLDPMHLTAQDYDLAPERVSGPAWDGSWWAPEFYYRRAGPLAPLEYQIGMFRRQNNPTLAAAMQWDTLSYIFAPPAQVIAAVIAMKGPDAPKVGIRDTMTSARLRGIATGLPSGPTVLSLEMAPRTGPGTSGRARFAINAPQPLSAFKTGELGLSDPILVRADTDAPRQLQEAVSRMLGTTRLVNPARVGVFWETYGFRDRDSVDVAVRVTRRDETTILDAFAIAFGFKQPPKDSIIVRWSEPRPGDPTATVEGNTTIHPRGITLNVSQLPQGLYNVEIVFARGAVVARSSRDFSIVRRPAR